MGAAPSPYIRSWSFAVDVAAATPLDELLRWLLRDAAIPLLDGGELPRWLLHDTAGLAFAHLRLVKLLRLRDWWPATARELVSPRYARFHFGVVPVVKMCARSLVAVHCATTAWLLLSRRAAD
eukprot:gene40865-23015_t